MGQDNSKARDGELISEGGLVVQKGVNDNEGAHAEPPSIPRISKWGWGAGSRMPTKKQRTKRRGKNNTKVRGQLGYLPGEVSRGSVADFYRQKAMEEEEMKRSGNHEEEEEDRYTKTRYMYGLPIDPPRPPSRGQKKKLDGHGLLNRALSVDAELFTPISQSSQYYNVDDGTLTADV